MRPLLVLLLAWTAAGLAATPRPNLVLLLADDLGYGDLGCYGGTLAPTPHLDALARAGVRCTDAYVTSPSCAPSRLSLMAGAYSQRFGLTWNDDRSAHRLTETQRLLPEVLRAAGYATGLVGKWNIVRPAAAVFDEVMELVEWESDYHAQPDGRYIGSGATSGAGVRSSKTQGWGPEGDGGEYLTDRMARRAAEFVSRRAREPFFLFVGFNAVHSPWQGRRQDRDRFGHLPHEVQRLYASMLAALDEGVGRIIAALREHGLEENTLVVFLSDNGPAKGGPHIEGWKPDWPAQLVVGSAGPLRGAKTDLWEGGIREPLLLRWPAGLPAGAVYRSPVIATDLLPTFCAAAGVSVPEANARDGVDLLPHLRGQRTGAPHDILFWKIKSATAVRRGDWKLVRTLPDGTPHLYHLGEDLGETRDRASERPEVVRELHAAWEAWNRPLPPPARAPAPPR